MALFKVDVNEYRSENLVRSSQRVEQVRRAQSEGNVYPHKSLVLAWAFYEHYRSGLRQWPISHVLGETERLLDLFGRGGRRTQSSLETEERWALRDHHDAILSPKPGVPATTSNSAGLRCALDPPTDGGGSTNPNRDRLNDAFEVLIDEIPAGEAIDIHVKPFT